MSPVLKLEGEEGFNGSKGVEGGPIFESNPPQSPSVYIYLRYLYSPLCTRTPSVVVSCGSKIFYFSPIPPFHAAFQVERISISLKHCHMSPPLCSSRFLKYRFKRSITDIHNYSLPIEASIYFIYTVHIYIHIYRVLFLTL